MKTISFLKFILIGVITFLPGIASVQSQSLSEELANFAREFEDVNDFNEMLDEIDRQKLVLMGEASHGTSEFYVWRAELSKKLIEEKGYNFIAVEGDWPAMARINEYVKHKPNAPETLDDAMAYIDRWPLWMWRNHEVKSLLEWLHDYNEPLAMEDRVGFYGVDLYAKRAAIQNVVDFFEGIDSEMAARADRAYSCMTRFGDVQGYLRMVQQSGEDCVEEMDDVLDWVRTADGFDATDWTFFNAEHNALLAKNAEEHFRGNLQPGSASWNSRATHFYETAERLLEYYGNESRGIVWAHNTHIGDARATDMGRQGAVNIGQLAREDLGEENVFAIGFGTYEGRVLAGRQWEGEMEVMNTPPALDDTWESTLAGIDGSQFYFLFNQSEINNLLQNPIPHRAIGVTYQPEQESQGNYVGTVLPDRYNAFIFIRETDILDVLD